MSTKREIAVTPGSGDAVGVVDTDHTDGDGRIITAQAVQQLDEAPSDRAVLERLDLILLELRMLNELLVEGFSLGTTTGELRPAITANKG